MVEFDIVAGPGNDEFGPDDDVDEDDDDDDDADGNEDDGTEVASISKEGIEEDEDEDDKSSALVPEPSRYSLPRHLIVEEPVNALK